MPSLVLEILKYNAVLVYLRLQKEFTMKKERLKYVNSLKINAHTFILSQ